MALVTVSEYFLLKEKKNLRRHTPVSTPIFLCIPILSKGAPKSRTLFFFQPILCVS